MRRPTGKVLLFGSIGAVIVALMLLVDGDGVFSHSGRTDSSGGHYNRSTGTYHYHGTPKSSTPTYSRTTPSSGTQSSTVQSGAVQSSEIAELASEMKRLRASVEALDASVQKLVKRAGGASADIESTVYITRTGKKYHRGSCRYLRSSKIPISLTNAKRGYSPCSVCDP